MPASVALGGSAAEKVWVTPERRTGISPVQPGGTRGLHYLATSLK